MQLGTKLNVLMLAGSLAAAAPLMAQNQPRANESGAQGQAVVTVMPAKGKEAPANVSAQDVSIKVNGKESTVTNFTPLRDANSALEVVVMMDSGARMSLATQLNDIAEFVKNLPPDAKVGLAYMQNGMAQMSGPLTKDHTAALKGLHIPVGSPGQDASPYFCLSDLAKRWPSNDRNARREVVMITDGFDYYHPSFDLQDPYVQTAIHDAVRANLVVYSIYWQNKGRINRTEYANSLGQNLLLQVTKATGGNSYWQGLGNPVELRPYFQDIQRRFENQYELSFTAPSKGGIEQLKLKLNGISGKVDAPDQVYVSKPL